MLAFYYTLKIIKIIVGWIVKQLCPQATCDPAQDGQWTPGNEVYCKAIFTLLQHTV